MNIMSLEEIHKYELGCLIYFDTICRKYGLRYSLAFGTLIGAMRHKGFIPWDDDIDVLMMREDYEKLVQLFLSNNEKDMIYGFLNENNNEMYHYTIGRIIDKRTKIHFTSCETDVEGMGVFIDIYPVDYIPENLFIRKIINWIMIVVVNGLLANSEKKSRFAQTIGFKKSFFHLIFRILGKKKIYKIYHKLLDCLPQKGIYCDDLWDRFYLLDASFEAEWFDELCVCEFEGYKFYAFKEADTFLRNHYGDYMEYPPLEQRVPHHDYEAYLI